MKTTKTMWAISIALLTAIGCTETETGIEPEPGSGGDHTALGITTNLKVEAGTRATTKSLVDGKAITYAKAYYKTAVPGLGVVVTNSGATDWYVPDGDNIHHVWYMGDENGANWKSITTKGNDFDATKEAPYYLTETVGQVYAYYPYDENAISGITLSGAGENNLKIPVKVLGQGTIDASVNNAAKYWDGGKWASTKSPVKLSEPTETDYLYFAAEGGRYVNNGRAKSGDPLNPEDGPQNDKTDNPGYLIELDMNHALAMVSFRVYDGGHLSDKAVTFNKFEIKNNGEGSTPFKVGNGKMALKDGAISETTTTTGMARTVTGYTLMRQIESGAESAGAFISTGIGTSKINGQTVSKTVSALVYPTSFSDGDIDVDITLEVLNESPVTYTVSLPEMEWEKGENYIYTFSAGRNKLTLMSVSVEPWHDNDQGEIPL